MCELHFRKEDILRFDRKTNIQGKLIVNPNKQSKLRKKNGVVDVIPIVPLNNQLIETSTSVQTVVGANNKSDEIITEENIDKSIDVTVDSVDSNDTTSKIISEGKKLF